MRPRIEENGIVFEVEVGRDEALATLELYKQICPGQSSLSSLQGVLQAMDKGGVSTHTHTNPELSLCCWPHKASLANQSSSLWARSTCLWSIKVEGLGQRVTSALKCMRRRYW